MKIGNINDIKVKNNTYRLTFDDDIWLLTKINEDSLTLIKGLIKRRFPKADLRKYNKRKLSNAAINIIKRNEDLFSTSIRGKYYFNKFCQIPKYDYDTIIENFEYVIKGFSDYDINKEKKFIPNDKIRYINTIDKCIKTNEKLNKKAIKDGSDYKKRKYEENIKKLKTKRNDIEIKFSDINECAKRRCQYKSLRKRQQSFGISTIYERKIKIDYLGLNFFLNQHNPFYVNFPLKFMSFLPYTLYRSLLKSWESNPDRDKIIKRFEKFINRDTFFNELDNLYENNINKISENRKHFLSEIKYLYQNNLFASCTLLTMTQIEGMLWELGGYLNRKRKFIFKKDTSKRKIKYYPYLWNKKTKEYKDLKTTGYPKYIHKNLRSARDLLELTRLREFVNEQLLAYLIDDFADERNKFTHGNIEQLNKKETSSYALLLLYSFLDHMADL